MRFFITLFAGAMGQDMGPTRLIDLDRLPEDKLNYYHNRAYFCNGCGRVWARWEKDQADFVGFEWYPYRRSCPDHQQGAWTGDRPGSLILYPSDIVVLPRTMLEAELLNFWRNDDNEQRAPDSLNAGSSVPNTSGDGRQ